MPRATTWLALLLLVSAPACTGRRGGDRVRTDGGVGVDANRPEDCTEPPTQGLSEPCCPGHGVDACGAGLFCAAFDGRTIPSCYPERSRLDGESCTADAQCVSESCNVEVSRCRWGSGECESAVGCAPVSGSTRVCARDMDRVYRCNFVGSGADNDPCAVDADCHSGTCDAGASLCVGPCGLEVCDYEIYCPEVTCDCGGSPRSLSACVPDMEVPDCRHCLTEEDCVPYAFLIC